jgi:hypothetical protein
MSELMIMRYTYEDNEKGGSKRIYDTNGVGYTFSSVPVKSWPLSCLNSQGNIGLSVGLIYIQPSKPKLI